LEGTSVGHPVQPPAEAGSPTAGCTGPCLGGSSISPEQETPQPPWTKACIELSIIVGRQLLPAAAALGPCCPGFAHGGTEMLAGQGRQKADKWDRYWEQTAMACSGERLFIPGSEGRLSIHQGATPRFWISLVWNAAISGMSSCNYVQVRRTSTTFARKEGGILCSIARQNRNQQLGFFSKSGSIFSAIKSELDGSLVPTLLLRCERGVLQRAAPAHAKTESSKF